MVEEVKQCPHDPFCTNPAHTRTDPTPSVVKDGATGEGEGKLQRLLMDAQAQCPPSYAETWMKCIQPVLDARIKQLAAANAEIALAKSALVTALATNDDIAQQLVEAKAEIEKLKGENAFHIAQMVKGDADNAALCAVLAQCERAILQAQPYVPEHHGPVTYLIKDALSAIAGLKEKNNG